MPAKPRHLRSVDSGPTFPPVKGTPEYDALVAKSASEGKHIGDEMRAEIMARFDRKCHIRGDKAPPLKLPKNWKAPE
jgi:hypothetical protein